MQITYYLVVITFITKHDVVYMYTIRILLSMSNNHCVSLTAVAVSIITYYVRSADPVAF